MPAQRISMRKFKEVLRLTHCLGLTHRQVARSLGLSKTTVSKYLDLAASARLSWPLPDGISDGELTRLLFPNAETGSLQQFTIPDFPSFIRNSNAKESPSSCFGKNTHVPILALPISTRSFATSTNNGALGSRLSCVKLIALAKSSS